MRCCETVLSAFRKGRPHRDLWPRAITGPRGGALGTRRAHSLDLPSCGAIPTANSCTGDNKPAMGGTVRSIPQRLMLKVGVLGGTVNGLLGFWIILSRFYRSYKYEIKKI